MKRTLLSLIVALTTIAPLAAQTFYSGADVSWCSEMEADGKKFYNTNGSETELMQLLHDGGMNAIRLRVWVNPESAYGAWSDKADVLAKAQRVKAAGMELMIDLHYSDFFADPSRQDKPAAWAAYSFDQLKQAVADHTRDILQALKSEGIEPRWVQVGNETTNGMLWPDGKLWNGTADKGWGNYVALSNAGYDAVKSVLPDAQVIVHHDKGANDPTWFYTDFKNAGGKLDAIGLSHYPESNWASENTALATAVRNMYSTHKVPVLIVETGYAASNEQLASQVMTDLFTKLRAVQGCAGIFYWEPQLYGWWRPAYYVKLNWQAYNKGAFASTGRPGKALDAFWSTEDAVEAPAADSDRTSAQATCYDLSGRPVDTATHRGIMVVDGQKAVAH
mgnify:CR=1 FL=1